MVNGILQSCRLVVQVIIYLVNIHSNPELTPKQWASAVVTSVSQEHLKALENFAETLLTTLLLPREHL